MKQMSGIWSEMRSGREGRDTGRLSWTFSSIHSWCVPSESNRQLSPVSHSVLCVSSAAMISKEERIKCKGERQQRVTEHAAQTHLQKTVLYTFPFNLKSFMFLVGVSFPANVTYYANEPHLHLHTQATMTCRQQICVDPCELCDAVYIFCHFKVEVIIIYFCISYRLQWLFQAL